MSYSNQRNLQELKERKRFLQESIKYKTRRLEELQLKEAKYGQYNQRLVYPARPASARGVGRKRDI